MPHKIALLFNYYTIWGAPFAEHGECPHGVKDKVLDAALK